MSEKIGAVPVVILPDEVQKIRGAEIKRLRVQCPERLGLALTHSQLRDFAEDILWVAYGYHPEIAINAIIKSPEFQQALEGLGND